MTEDLVRDVFGEVHMLSHLVGAANRADIRRLGQLEAENAALQETVSRQQRHLRDAIVSRDADIASLNAMLAKVISDRQPANAAPEGDGNAERTATTRLISDLERLLAAEKAGRERAEGRLAKAIVERDSERKQRQHLDRRARDLQQDTEAAESSLAQLLAGSEPEDEPFRNLAGRTLLYVGGRAHHIPHLRKLAEQRSATFLHHDGGIDERTGLLENLVARADLTVFPVDCVSHNAVAVVQRVSRSVGKTYLALRSSGLTSFAMALRSLQAKHQAAAAEPQPKPTAAC